MLIDKHYYSGNEFDNRVVFTIMKMRVEKHIL